MAVVDDGMRRASSIAILRAADRGDKSSIQMSWSKIMPEAPKRVRPFGCERCGKLLPEAIQPGRRLPELSKVSSGPNPLANKSRVQAEPPEAIVRSRCRID